MGDAMGKREILIEFSPVGQYVKVTAMDVATLTEITIQGPATFGEQILKNNAVKRLEFVLRKKGIIG